MRAELASSSLLTGALLLSVFFESAPAYAFVCSQVDSVEGDGPALSWFTREPTYTFFVDGTEQLEGDLEREVLRASFAVWEGATSGSVTTDLRFVEMPVPSSVDRIGYNFAAPESNENLLIFREDRWPHPGQADVIGLTTVSYVALTGEILDADIEFNAVNFRFVADPSQPGACTPACADCPQPTDLMNTAVHEIGHFIGLSHVDDPSATMYRSTDSLCETKKRDLASDDSAGTVFKYPAGEPNGYCFDAQPFCATCPPPRDLSLIPSIEVTGRDDGMGCGCASAEAPLWLGVIGLVHALRRRIRRRR